LRTIILQFLCFTYILIMVVVALDPYLIITLNVKYNLIITRLKMQFMLSSCWVLGFINMVLSFLSDFKTREDVVVRYIFPVICSIFIVFSIYSYTCIFKKLKGRYSAKKPVVSITGGSTSQRTVKYRIPALIITSFIVFVFTPTVAYIFVRNQKKKMHESIVALCYAIGFVVDASVYLFLQPDNKAYICQKMRRESRIEPVGKESHGRKSSVGLTVFYDKRCREVIGHENDNKDNDDENKSRKKDSTNYITNNNLNHIETLNHTTFNISNATSSISNATSNNSNAITNLENATSKF